MNETLICEVPGLGYSIVNMHAKGNFFASDLESRIKDAKELMTSKSGESFTKAVLSGAGSALTLLGGYSLLLALAPCPMCKAGLYAGLITMEGAGGIGCLASSANIYARYARRKKIKDAVLMLENPTPVQELPPQLYEPLIKEISERRIDNMINEYKRKQAEYKCGPDGKKSCNGCRKAISKELKGMQAILADAYSSVESIARRTAESEDNMRNSAFNAIADAYSYAKKVYEGRMWRPLPAGLILR